MADARFPCEQEKGRRSALSFVASARTSYFFFGLNACNGAAAPPNPDPPEIQLRIGVRGQDRKAVDRFTRELIPLVLSGPPGATGFGEGRPPVREIVAYWPALIPRDEIRTRVEVIS